MACPWCAVENWSRMFSLARRRGRPFLSNTLLEFSCGPECQFVRPRSFKNELYGDALMASAQAGEGTAAIRNEKAGYNRFLLLVAGLGGLLYGVDVGIIAGALPYLEATSRLNAGQLSIVVAAVLLGSVISTLFAGLLADWMGRKPLMILSGLMFVVSIPVIALSQGYGPLVLGRLLQGVSAGLIGVVVPLYLAECLSASSRGKGTGIFQWLLTLGIVSAALVGITSAFALMKWQSSGMQHDCLRSKTQPGAAFSGFRCLRAFCLSWEVSWWRSLPGGCSGGRRETRRSRRCCGRGTRSRQIPNCGRWKRRARRKKPRRQREKGFGNRC